MSPAGDGQLFVGVVVTIPEPWATRLTAARAGFGDPRAARIPPHVTLVPPTPLGDMAALEDHIVAAARAVEPFRMHLRGTGTFRPISPVVFVQVIEGISRCEQLHGLLLAPPLSPELPFPFHPHVTVAQEVSDEMLDEAFVSLDSFEAVFFVTGIDLFTLGEDDIWRPSRRFHLGAPGQGR